MFLFTPKHVELKDNLIVTCVGCTYVVFIKQQPLKGNILMKVFIACYKLQFYRNLSND
jgi:hypothetical protein